MSSRVEPRASLVENVVAGRGNYRLILAGVFCVAVLGLVPVLVVLLRSTPPPATRLEHDDADDGLTAVVDDWAKETDLVTLKNGIQRLNSHYNQVGNTRPPTLTAEQRERLQKALTPDKKELSEEEKRELAEELAEIDASNFTALDAHYLDECFLLRDAAKALQADVTSAAVADPALRLTPLEQATAAFAWVVRQVRLEQASAVPMPPQFILRRGQGTALVRALIFLDLLRQLNTDNDKTPLFGCLIVEPGESAAQDRLWAVGVVIGTSVYLFDPRLGLPIPGPGGKGVATLAEAIREPGVLGQLLTVNEKNEKVPYDMKGEQARASDVFLYCTLSALAPRMGFLQKEVLAPRVRVNLGADLGREEVAAQAAVDAAGSKAKVRPHPLGGRLLRNFLPGEEGGADRKPFGMGLNQWPGFAAQGNSTQVTMFLPTMSFLTTPCSINRAP